MDVNERFDQWLKSLTAKDEINSSQRKGDGAAVNGGKKKDKKKETKDHNPKKGSRDDKNDTNKNKNDARGKNDVEDSLEDSIKLLDQYSNFHSNGVRNVSTATTGTSSEHDDLNEILKELTSSFEGNNSYYGEDNGVHGDMEPMVDISGGIHVNSTGRQSPKFLYKEPNSPNYMYFNPPTLSPGGRKSKLYSVSYISQWQILCEN